jgi:hypothetical protein
VHLIRHASSRLTCERLWGRFDDRQAALVSLVLTGGFSVCAGVEIKAIDGRIENRRIELGKTSGFKRRYARLTKLYLGTMPPFSYSPPPSLPKQRVCYSSPVSVGFEQVKIHMLQLK